MSKRVVLLGQPVTHSLSEALQMAAFEAAGVDASYEPIDTPTVDLSAAVKALRSEEYLGANIGVPHKDRVVPILDKLTEEAQATGAVDTITIEGEQLVGHNTDVIAFKPALEELVGSAKMPKNAVVVGAGGGGRAAIYSLIQAGFHNVALFNRHLHRGERLVKHFGRSASHMELKARPWHESVIEAELAKTDILINASAMGRDPEETPIPGELLPPDILVMDLHYVPEETRLLKEAKEAGAAKAMNGDVMLIEQTVAAFELWTGEKAPRSVIEKTLKKARNKPDEPVPSAEEMANGEATEASA